MAPRFKREVPNDERENRFHHKNPLIIISARVHSITCPMYAAAGEGRHQIEIIFKGHLED